MDFSNHYNIAVTEVEHKGKTILTSLNTNLPNFLKGMEVKEIEVGYIPAGYEHRPDLISNLFYDTVTFDWLICMFNNISDPFQQLNINDRILIPRL